MKTTALITTDVLTVARMSVIGSRTGSTLIAGAKAMMIENAKKQMKLGVCHFIYEKKNGKLREAYGCLNPCLVSEHTNGRGESREQYYTSAYFDVEKGAWRSFRWENIVAVL